MQNSREESGDDVDATSFLNPEIEENIITLTYILHASVVDNN